MILTELTALLLIIDKCKLLLNLHDIFKNHCYGKETWFFISQSEVTRIVRMHYVLTHDGVDETEIADTRRKTQTSALKQWLILVKE